MDKKTVLAVAAIVVVISIGFFIQNRVSANRQEEGIEIPAETEITEGTEGTAETAEAAGSDVSSGGGRRSDIAAVEPELDLIDRDIVEETDLYIITFTSRGGDIKSLKMKEYKEKDGNPLDMIFRGDSDINAFQLHFGGYNVEPVDELFSYRKSGNDTFIFSRDFRAPPEEPGEEGDIFTLVKRYVFKPGEYMFELNVEIENSKNAYPNLENEGYSYTLSVGPQIGPEFVKLDNRRAVRRYQYYDGEKARRINLRNGNMKYVEGSSRWEGISGKYFSLLVVPDSANYDIAFSQPVIQGIPVGSRMFLSRPKIKSSEMVDTFRIYAGPNLKKIMDRYDEADKNAYGVRDFELSKAVRRSAILGWLESILRWILLGFYRLIPNYGVAIILLTIVIKIVLFPITRKSYSSTSKMQAINPKVQAIREKYKDNPQKMNQEVQALYKKEGVSPFGGCLPLVVQMPFFIALYGLLNNHFALRGAVFIPGWITDLSAPEYIWHHGVNIPVIGEYLRLLPILYVATQLISSRFMQSPTSAGAGGNQSQMKMMTYAMPIVFFFVLYDAPSGLLLYWMVTNILTVLQQYFISRIRKKKAAAQ